ncbi:hypothetical protein HI914_00956 [Erysiphe necator]|nr:hypothetical protein HI914_00956 [Erysiphe necator]
MPFTCQIAFQIFIQYFAFSEFYQEIRINNITDIFMSHHARNVSDNSKNIDELDTFTKMLDHINQISNCKAVFSQKSVRARNLKAFTQRKR